jgi:hypothetical protein
MVAELWSRTSSCSEAARAHIKELIAALRSRDAELTALRAQHDALRAKFYAAPAGWAYFDADGDIEHVYSHQSFSPRVPTVKVRVIRDDLLP